MQTVSSHERRISDRSSCAGLARFAVFNQAEQRRALITDFSREGLGLQSQQELKPGRYLSIRVEITRLPAAEASCEASVPSIGIAEVKWCRPIEDEAQTVFAAGVKFLLPGYSV